MYADVKIGEKVVPMLSNAATAIIYKQIFHKDLLVFMDRVNKALEKGDNVIEGMNDIILELAYVMATQAEKSGFRDKNFETYIEWLTQFEPMDIENAAAEIFGVYKLNTRTKSTPKNA